MSRRKFRAILQLRSTNEGGRASALRSGYRSLICFENVNRDFGFELALDADSLAPGQSGSGTISFWAEEVLPPGLVGQRFEIREGTRVVGHGVIKRE